MRSLSIFTPILLLTLAACATAPTPRAQTDRPVTAKAAAVPDLEERALLLLVSDRRSYEPIVFHQALDGGPELRRQAALALARIGDRRAGPALEGLLADPVAEVRRAATFALGELGERGYREAATALAGALLDPDREVGRRAVEALAKLAATLESVLGRLQMLPTDEASTRLLPSLYRFTAEEDTAEVLRWAERGLASGDPELFAWAVYGLAREARPEAAPLLRSLLAHGDPWVRGWAARGLGKIGGRADLELLRPLLDDPAPGPVVQALRAARGLIERGAAAAPESWRPRLLELLADPRPGVRVTAIEAAAAWLLDDEIGARLAELATTGERRERELALLALAEGEDPRGAVLALRLAEDPKPALRAQAAVAAGFFRSLDLLERLAADAHPRVRRAALETLLAAGPEVAAEWVAAALEDPDPAVRATVLGWLEENPVVEMETLVDVTAAARRDRLIAARLAGVRALGARALAEPAERGAIVAALEGLERDGEFLVRRQASQELVALERTPSPTGPVETRRPLAVYRQIVERTARSRRVEVETERGAFVLELACPEAPLTCLNFLQLAGQGFYDGLELHRVVPDFVVQGGDPRGDGLGGPGYTLRDELNLLRFDRGVLGMAHSGPDTAGSQFFITLSPQPHLDGTYTAFGRVVEGFEVLERLLQGDRVVRVVVAPPGGGGRGAATLP